MKTLKSTTFKLRTLVLAGSLAALAGCQSPEEKVQDFVDKAIAQIESGDYEAAHIEFSNALQINPNHVEGLYRVTEVFESEQKWKKVHQYLERVLELDPDHVDALHKIARLEVAARELGTAQLRAQRLARLDPNSARTPALFALISVTSGDNEEAREQAQKALAIDPASEAGGLVMANLALQAGDVDRALALAEAIPVDDSVSVDMFRINAVIQTNDLERVVAVFEDVIARRDGLTSLSVQLAARLANDGQIERGRQVLLKAMQGASPEDDVEASYLAYVNRFMGQDALLQALDRLIDENPERLDLLMRKAMTLYSVDSQEAPSADVLALLQTVADRGKGTDEGNQAQVSLATSAYATGDTARGDALIEAVLAEDPEQQSALRIRAERWIAQGEVDRGLTALRAIQADNANDPRVAMSIARAHLALERYDLAIDQYRRAANSAPANVEMALEYAELLRDREQFAEADAVLSANLAAVDEDDARVIELLADTKLARQDWSGATELAQRLKTMERDTDLGRQIEALALIGQNRFADGLSALHAIFEQGENQAGTLVALVLSYQRAGRADEALAFLQQVREADPDNLLALRMQARTLRAMDELGQAEARYRELLALAPSSLPAYAELAGLMMRQGDPAGSLAVLSRGWAASPTTQTCCSANPRC